MYRCTGRVWMAVGALIGLPRIGKLDEHIDWLGWKEKLENRLSDGGGGILMVAEIDTR